MVLVLSSSVLYLPLGAASLKYRVAKHKPSRVAIQTFLDELRFPLNIVFADRRGPDFFGKRINEYPLDYLERLRDDPTEELFVFAGGRWVLALIMLGLTIVMFYASIETAPTVTTSVFELAISLVFLAELIYFWDFGRQLKHIEARLQENKKKNADVGDFDHDLEEIPIASPEFDSASMGQDYFFDEEAETGSTEGA